MIKNADLLISPDFQGDASSASSLSRSNSELTCGKVRLLLEQQETISELRCKLDKMLRLNERLQLDLNAQQLGDSPAFKAQDLIKIQNLELLNQRFVFKCHGFKLCYKHNLDTSPKLMRLLEKAKVLTLH